MSGKGFIKFKVLGSDGVNGSGFVYLQVVNLFSSGNKFGHLISNDFSV